MGWIRRLRRSLLPSEETFDEEAQFHLEQRTNDFIADGLSPEEARRAAERRFGNRLSARERTADADRLRWIDDLRRDGRYGLRVLWRNPGFSLLAVLCLTLGIGANASVFSWIEGLLLRPYPLVVEQERLYAVTGTERGAAGTTDMSWPDWQDLQRSSTLVDAFIAEKITGTTLSVGDRAERAPGSIVSANYFDAVGVRPALGRGFLPEEETGRNAHPVTVISHQAWQDRYGGDPAIVGRTQMLNGLAHTIVGVAPEGFYGTFVGYAFQFWVPASMQPQFHAGVYKLDDRSARWIEGFVRLKPGVSREQAEAELSAIMARLEATYPDTNRGVGIRLFPLWRTPFNNAGAMVPTLGIALGVVLAVLLIACANVGNLLLVRAITRHQEMTIRLSIGGGRARLVRQLLTEALILSGIAAAGGFAMAHALRGLLTVLTPPRGGVVLRLAGELDWRVFLAVGGVAVAATVLFGVVPALVASRIDLASALRAHAGSLTGSRRSAWLRSALVIVQIALSVVLLISAGLLLKTFQAVRDADPGFSTSGVLTTSVDAFAAGYDVRRARIFQDGLIDQVRSLPGIEAADFSTTTPFSYASGASAPIAVDDYVPPPDQQPTASYNAVGPDYFATLAIPIVAGRAFTPADDDDSAAVAIVDQTMAAQFWGSADPVGSRVRTGQEWRRVVGVARSIKTRNLLETAAPYFYVPLRQKPSPTVGLHVRTRLTPGALRAALVRAIHALDPGIAPGELIPMREQVERTTAPQRITVTMLIVFSGLALVLAVVGLYGVMAATVAQTNRQLALRIALGADAVHVCRLVVGRGLGMAGAGAALGVIIAFETTRLMGYVLYQVNSRDPATFASAVGVVAVATAAACVSPVRRATRTDPLQALRG